MVSRIRLSPQGPEFARLVPGVMRLLDWELSTQDLVGWIEACLDIGMTTFDHADIYGGYQCETLFGEALKTQTGLRERLEIITKCDIMMMHANRPPLNLKHYDTSRSHVMQSVETSLRNLNTDYIDLLLIHRPDALMDADEVATAFQDLKQSGKVRYFGVSNHSLSQFDLLQSRLDFPLVTNQVEFSVTHLDPLHDGSFDHAQRLRYAPMAWSPLGGGSVFYPNNEQTHRLHHVLTQIGRVHDAAIDQVMLAWILRHPANILPVLGTGKLDRLRGAMGAESIELSREEWYAIWSASTGIEVP